MWERFSYYGMRGFLILYMTKALGFTDSHASSAYATYVSSVWLTPIIGGFIADRWLGQYRSVLIGGIIIALGHFTLAFPGLPSPYSGLTLIVPGTGLAEQKRERAAVEVAQQQKATLTSDDWRRISAVVVLFLFASLFWGAYEQAGSTLTLFADRYVHLELLGLRLYASWFVSVQAAFV